MSQEEFKVRAIKPIFINPSIMEGEKLYTSALGPNRAVPIDRYAPLNIVAPTVSGSNKIPATLTVNNGVWDGSPSPEFTYQWTADGLPIAGATGKTLLTYVDLDSMEIGCDVRAFSFLGELIVSSSNTILVGIIEPIIAQEIFWNAITGMDQQWNQNLMGHDMQIATGLWVDPRQDIMTKVECVMTGLWVDPRSDTMGFSGYTVTGHGLNTYQEVVTTETYTVETYEFLANLPIVNPGFETGTLSGWSLNYTPTSTSQDMRIFSTGSHSGVYHAGGPISTGTFGMYQDVAFPTEYDAEAANGNILVLFKFFTKMPSTQYNYDSILGYLSFFNDVGAPIGSAHSEPTIYPRDGFWDPISGEPVKVPVGTRTIRFNVVFQASLFSGNDCRIDTVSMDLLIATNTHA